MIIHHDFFMIGAKINSVANRKKKEEASRKDTFSISLYLPAVFVNAHSPTLLIVINDIDLIFCHNKVK